MTKQFFLVGDLNIDLLKGVPPT